MRPHRISLQAYGAFGGLQIVDFDLLEDNQLFQISGPTGSGKTTILDGVCFALFDEASGHDRTGPDMRSDHAQPDLLTNVILDFSVGPKSYRVSRSPRQDVPKKRGEGFTSQAANAVLWERSGVSDLAQDGVVLATQSRSVTKKVEEIVGLSADQLRQTFMLPQGEFRKVITADSKERAGILRKLFESSRYARIEEGLKQKRKALKHELEHFVTQRETFLKSVEVESVDELVQAIVALSEQVVVSEATTQKLTSHYQKQQTALERGKAVVLKLNELTLAAQSLDALEKQQDAMVVQEHTLKRANAAIQLRAPQHLLDTRKRELTDANNAHESASKQLKSAAVNLSTAKAAFEMEHAKESLRKESQKRVDQLQALVSQVSEWALAQQAASTLETAALEQQRRLNVAKGALETAGVEHKRAETQIQEARVAAAGLEAAQMAQQSATQMAGNRQSLDAMQLAQKDAFTVSQTTQLGLETANQALEQTRSTFQTLQTQQLEGQASLLARKLETGHACPVCGSDNHPQPAAAQEDMPTEEAVERARQAVAAAETEQASRQQAHSGASNDLVQKTTRVDSMLKQLGKQSETTLAELQSREAVAADKLKTATDAQRLLDSQSSRLEELAAAVVVADSAKKLAQELLVKTQAELAGAVALRTERGAKVPVDLREPNALESATQAAEHKLEALKAALQAAQESQAKSAEHYEKCAGTAKTLEAALETASIRLNDAQKELSQSIEEAGFKDAEDYEQACLADAQILVLQERLSDFKEALAKAMGRNELAVKAAAGLKRPELELLEAASEAAQQALSEHTQEHGSLIQDLQTRQQVKLQIEENARAQGQKNQQFEVVGRLSDVANGKNPAGLTFERYVLAAMLDDVLVATNQRFKKMTNGRFHLQRSEGVSDARKRGGLDLDVMDSYTGKTRSAKTLSGGEGFEAALALALGLADIVQAQAGGIHLDAIFVDEGFGSLSDEDLDAVMNALEDLQAGGRLVGVISHVSELGERIPARLEVTKGKSGSHAEFVLP